MCHWDELGVICHFSLRKSCGAHCSGERWEQHKEQVERPAPKDRSTDTSLQMPPTPQTYHMFQNCAALRLALSPAPFPPRALALGHPSPTPPEPLWSPRADPPLLPRLCSEDRPAPGTAGVLLLWEESTWVCRSWRAGLPARNSTRFPGQESL